MTLFMIDQHVTHDGKKWVITGFKVVDGKTKYCLKRGPYTKEVDETEIQ